MTYFIYEILKCFHRQRDDAHDGVYPRQLLKHLEAAADDQSAAGGSVAEDPEENHAA